MSQLTVIVPTRSRPGNVQPIVDAWYQTGAFGVANLVFGCDLDDMHFEAYHSAIGAYPQIKMGVFPEWKPLVPKMNGMAKLAADETPFVVFMGDDHIPRTRLWAHMLIEDHMLKRKGIWYGQDGRQDRKLPTWWSMDSQIIKKLDGRMVPAPVQHQYCDNAVKELGERSEQLGYDERILIEHMHPFWGKAESDAQYERVNRTQQYERDGHAFRHWVATQADQDAKLLADLGR